MRTIILATSILLIFIINCSLFGQVIIKDISPTFDNTNIVLSPKFQSVSGKALCIASSHDGSHVYLGGHSGVWEIL